MKSFLNLLMLAAAISISALAQEPATTPQSSSSTSNTPVEQQSNAASAIKDTSGARGDQATKPAEAKGTTLIGCLSGPNPEGRLVLTSMQHRTGVEVLGPDDLKNDIGTKVKLTGAWEASPQPNAKAARRFRVTATEVLSQQCTVPSEKTPVSKEKQRQREEQQQQKQSNPGGSPSPKSVASRGPIPQTLEQFLRIQQDRNRPAIHQLNFHHFLEASRLAAQAKRANRLYEPLIQLSRMLRSCGRIERRPLAAPHVSKKRELRDRQDRPTYLRHAKVHLPGFILKDP